MWMVITTFLKRRQISTPLTSALLWRQKCATVVLSNKSSLNPRLELKSLKTNLRQQYA